MADISQIKLPDDNTYNFKDTLARGLKMYYGLCTSAADTAAKVVTVGAEQDFKLTVGALLMVKFTKSNTASNVTLNVNSTGAKGIYYNNAVYTGNSNSVCGYANANFIYMYGGSNWIWVGRGANTTYNAMSVAEGETATGTNSRTMRADYLKQIIQYHAVPAGQGVPSGGTTGQILAKADDTDYNTGWIDAPSGGGVKNYYINSSNISSWRVPSDDNYDVYIDGVPVASWPTASTSIIKIVPVAVQQTIYVRVRKFDNKYVNEVTYYSSNPALGHITFYRPGLSGTWYVKENHDYIFGKLYVTGTDITFSVSDAGHNVDQLLKTICTNNAKLYYSSILNAPFYVTEAGSSNKGVEYYRITWEGTSNTTRAMVITGCVACNAANAILNFKIKYVVNDGTITKTITKVTTS